GENDVYRAEQFNVDKVEWVVLNRWGQGVNAGSGPVLEWDGRDWNSGRELAEGVYFIRATAYGNDGSTRTEQQTVHLMR
ncbi:gliding motility-associated C-terminal domain-containing protein, partial [bacterium]|nr:gliding motility-associated C-terminal domain-containing protein [bacterium]